MRVLCWFIKMCCPIHYVPSIINELELEVYSVSCMNYSQVQRVGLALTPKKTYANKMGCMFVIIMVGYDNSCEVLHAILLHACVSNNYVCQIMAVDCICRLYDPLPELTPLSHLMFIV